MLRKNILFIAFFILTITTISVFGQKAAKVEIKKDESSYIGGKLYASINGKSRKIADEATDAWIIDNGKSIVYSTSDRTRGFEGEGESLTIYDVKTGKSRQIMAEHTFVTGLTETKLGNGKTALLISMGDGGLGGSYFAVVDPNRGEVLAEGLSELIALKGDKITLAYYKEEDWEAINQERGWDDKMSQGAFAKATKVKPAKTQIFDLKEVLKNKVIYTKTNEELAKEYESKYSNLTIYLWRPNDKAEGKEYFLMAVGREFPKTVTPLKVSLESLFAGATDLEKKDGWESAVFGMKFEGVVLKNGVATIKVSQPKVAGKIPAFAPKMFSEAVEKTAKQFPSVKKVEICTVGQNPVNSEIGKQLSKCQ